MRKLLRGLFVRNDANPAKTAMPSALVQSFHVDIPPFGMLNHKILQLRRIAARLAAA